MDFHFSSVQLQKPKLEPDQSFVSTDAGYFSACGSLSPSSSVDSGCFSPPFSWWGANRSLEASGKIPPERVPARKPRLLTSTELRRCSRSRNPGIKRQTASEREKLRMRDLTKALHHLRTYLPASTAPQAQTLTKIETLRLAISYISYLSDQLRLSGTSSCYSSGQTTERLQEDLLRESWRETPSERLQEDLLRESWRERPSERLQEDLLRERWRETPSERLQEDLLMESWRETSPERLQEDLLRESWRETPSVRLQDDLLRESWRERPSERLQEDLQRESWIPEEACGNFQDFEGSNQHIEANFPAQTFTLPSTHTNDVMYYNQMFFPAT